MNEDKLIEEFRTSINALCRVSLRIAQEHGFEPDSIAESVALMHSECSEVLEDARNGCHPTEVWYETRRVSSRVTDEANPLSEKAVRVETVEVTKYLEEGPGRKPCGIPFELADIMIRVAHFAGYHGIDLGKAILEKTTYNKSRPHKHGKQF